MKLNWFSLFLLFQANLIYSQVPPVSPFQTERIDCFALIHADLNIKPGVVIRDGTLVFRGGVITGAGAGIPIPAGARIIDLKGKSVYAGWIEAAALNWTKTTLPAGTILKPRKWNPNVQPETSVFDVAVPDEKIVGKFRSAGFTTACFHAPDGILRGESAVLDLGFQGSGKDAVPASPAWSLSLDVPAAGPDPNSEMGAIALIRQTFFDAAWYESRMEAWKKNPGATSLPAQDAALESLIRATKNKPAFFCVTTDELQIPRFERLSAELGFSPVFIGSGMEFKWLKSAGNFPKHPFILPLTFPKAPDVSSPEKALNATLDELLEWDFAPENPALVQKEGFPVALTTRGLPDGIAFLSALRLAVQRGLAEPDAIRALTETPAKLLGISQTHGTLEPGKNASFFIASGPVFSSETVITDLWIRGIKISGSSDLPAEPKGTYGKSPGTNRITVSGSGSGARITLDRDQHTFSLSQVKQENGVLSGTFRSDSPGKSGVAALSLSAGKAGLDLTFLWPDGTTETRFLPALPDSAEPHAPAEKQPVEKASFPLTFPFGAYGREGSEPEQPAAILVKSATLWTAGPDENREETDLLVQKGKISLIGKNLKSPAGALVLDGHGKHVTPGIIDAHSHTAISNGVNETGQGVSAEVRIGDVVDPTDISIYRQLAGGVTTSNLMHGSANAIGGQTQIVKFRWGQPAENLKFKDAFPGIKFALGENPRQANRYENTRYPKTRMGVYEVIRDEFIRAAEYKTAWETWKKNPDQPKPRRDLELEAISEILDGKRGIQCHSYVQSEILALIRIGDELGFKVKAFQHILEGYKVAGEMARHGAGGSGFSDWWAYKYEVIDAIPYNGPMMEKEGVVVSFNSDSDELARRLNTEAAKAVKYGGVSPGKAIRYVTLNAAVNLGIDHLTGSLEPGKDADFVIWDGNPLSTFSRPDQTWIDGRLYFDRSQDKADQEKIDRMKKTLIQKILNSGVPMEKSLKEKVTRPKMDRCLEVYDETGLMTRGDLQ